MKDEQNRIFIDMEGAEFSAVLAYLKSNREAKSNFRDKEAFKRLLYIWGLDKGLDEPFTFSSDSDYTRMQNIFNNPQDLKNINKCPGLKDAYLANGGFSVTYYSQFFTRLPKINQINLHYNYE